MAYVLNATLSGAAPAVVPTGGPPGLRGPAGADSTVPGPQGREGPAGPQGPAGAGSVTSRRASSNVPLWAAVVASEANRCIPADPSNPEHRGQVIGVTAYGGMTGAQVSIQSVGDLLGPVASFSEGTPLFVGTNGSLTPTPPTSGWSQIVATAVSSSQVVVALGEARFIADEGTALVVPAGFATVSQQADVEAASASDKFLVPANLQAVAAPGNPVGDAIDSKVAAQNPALVGTSRLTGAGPTTDLISSIPTNGTFTGAAGASGAPFQAEPALGPFHDVAQDLTRAQTVRYFTASGDSNKGEYATLYNMIATNGFPTAWQAGKAYPEGGTCLNDGGKMYRVAAGTRGGTTAASGSGPTGTGSSINDGTVIWRYEPNFSPGNGGKTNLCLMTYQDSNSGPAWTGAFAHQIAAGGFKKNAYTLELDLNNYWGDYAGAPNGPVATALQIFLGGTHRSSSAISIGQYDTPSQGTSLVNGMVFGGATLVRDNTIYDLTGSYNGIFNQGYHAGSAFTNGSNSAIAFNTYGDVGIGFRHSGTSGVGLKLEGVYTGFQVQGIGWNVNGSGAATATGFITNNGFNFTTDATQDIGTASTRARNLYLANNPIIGSDQSLKTPLEAFTDKQLDAWGKVRLGLFQYLSAVDEKGEDKARVHAGVIAQQVVKALGKDAFRYGVVGRDPLTRTVTKTRKISVPKTETAEVEDTINTVEDGRAVRRVVVRTDERPVLEHVPLWNEDGSPVMTRRVRLGGDGQPVSTHLPEQNDEGEMVMRPRPEADVYETIQATHSQPVMVEVDEAYEAEEPDLDDDGKQRVLLNIRYDQLSVWEAAYQRRRADRIEARLAALEARLTAS